MMTPGTTAPHSGPRKPPPWKSLPPPVGPMGLPTLGEGPRLDIFCAKAPSTNAKVSAAAVKQSRAVRCARMIRPPIAAVLFVLLGRGDEADDLVFLQLLHDAGEFTLRNAGHSDADFIEPASHRSGRD